MTTGERIKVLRLRLGMSQSELGAKIGVKTPAIYKYENGLVVNLKRSTIEKLANALNTTPSYLMGFDDEKEPTPENEDGLDDLDRQLIELLPKMSNDQKEFLLAQIETTIKRKKESQTFQNK